MQLLHTTITEKILKAFYTVYNELGYGFLEKVYENALLHELQLLGLKCTKQQPIAVHYKNKVVGEYFADIVVEGMVIIELKATAINEAHVFQLLNYLKATDVEVGLLLSFGKKPAFERRVFENVRKG